MGIKHLVYRVAHNFNGGVVSLSSLMNKNEKVMQHKINPNNSTHFVTIEELETIADFTNSNLAIAQYFADKAGALVYVTPDMTGQDEQNLLDAFISINSHVGHISTVFSEAYGDGTISEKERLHINREIDDAERALLVLKDTVNRIAK
jgi:hypothetical protein